MRKMKEAAGVGVDVEGEQARRCRGRGVEGGQAGMREVKRQQVWAGCEEGERVGV